MSKNLHMSAFIVNYTFHQEKFHTEQRPCIHIIGFIFMLSAKQSFTVNEMVFNINDVIHIPLSHGWVTLIHLDIPGYIKIPSTKTFKKELTQFMLSQRQKSDNYFI